ncbi:hypothetical protein CDAR_389531 [Caerostris darwini]|uniref:Uncharacterized protein n=1 Tax=Caerostris darwini TaxID=1538125 RepID=A0AAV4P132_9ARAC|nr:hypothetical protein CDAR_389531 [Caerostris darwini]
MPKSNFPTGGFIHGHEKGWMDENGVKLWIRNVWQKRPGALKNPGSLGHVQMPCNGYEETADSYCRRIDGVFRNVYFGQRLLKSEGLSGKGELTDGLTGKFQNCYCIAIRCNIGYMQHNLIAALVHCASSSKKPMHGRCLLG